jgi:hypothetical protein
MITIDLAYEATHTFSQILLSLRDPLIHLVHPTPALLLRCHFSLLLSPNLIRLLHFNFWFLHVDRLSHFFCVKLLLHDLRLFDLF